VNETPKTKAAKVAKRPKGFANLTPDQQKLWLELEALRHAKKVHKLPKEVIGRILKRLTSDGRVVVVMSGDRFTTYTVEDYMKLVLHGQKLGHGELTAKPTPAA
jgi:hypothetical protein